MMLGVGSSKVLSKVMFLILFSSCLLLSSCENTLMVEEEGINNFSDTASVEGSCGAAQSDIGVYDGSKILISFFDSKREFINIANTSNLILNPVLSELRTNNYEISFNEEMSENAEALQINILFVSAFDSPSSLSSLRSFRDHPFITQYKTTICKAENLCTDIAPVPKSFDDYATYDNIIGFVSYKHRMPSHSYCFFSDPNYWRKSRLENGLGTAVDLTKEIAERLERRLEYQFAECIVRSFGYTKISPGSLDLFSKFARSDDYELSSQKIENTMDCIFKSEGK